MSPRPSVRRGGRRTGAESRRRLLLRIGGIALAMGLGACGGSGGAGSTDVLAIAAEGPTTAARGLPFHLRLRAFHGSGSGYRWRIPGEAVPPGLGLVGDDGCPTWGAVEESGRLDATLGEGRLAEVSGIAVSRRNPGILWVHDDGGERTDLYALRPDGQVAQRFHLDVPAVDWEDLALGPGPDPGTEYLYVGDVGDNGARRPSVWILRVVEPIVPPAAGPPIPLAADVFHVAYPGGPRDCEVLLLDGGSGSVTLCEKDDRGADAFRTPGPLNPAWDAAHPALLLPVTSGRPLPPGLTGGDATRDGRRVILRGYLPVGFEYARREEEPFESLFTKAPCLLAVPTLPQYEAIAYGPSGLSLVTTSERSILPSVPLVSATATVEGAEVAIAGRPTASGSFPLLVEVRDGAGATARLSLDLLVE